MQKFLIIDGTALVFRGFYAVPKLSTPNGQPTNAILGYFTILINLLIEQKPDYLAVCFDRPEETQRKKDFADYKATRVKAPDDLYSQIQPIKDILSKGGLNLVELAGTEADDLIATLAKTNKSSDLNTLIYSSDLDLLQLVDEHIKILKPGNSKIGNKIVDTAFILGKYGFSPLQVQDYKGLHGDSSDNLPGVRGVGEKTATKLIQDYGSLDSIYQNLDKLSENLKQKLLADKDQAYMCKQLATLHSNCPINTNLTDYTIHNTKLDVITKMLEDLDISKLTYKIQKLKNKIELVNNNPAQTSLF